MRYKNDNGISYKTGKDGEEMLANFTASIIRETTYVGGPTPEKTLTLVGEQPNPEGGEPIQLPEITMSDSEFVGMAWPLKYWGVTCIILPGSGNKEDLKTSIQFLSKPDKATIYRQTGWATLEDGRRAYLHRGGAITSKGNDDSVSVQLPTELRYDLSTGVKLDPKECVLATLDLIKLAPADVTWPLLAATLAPLYGPVDFGIHVTGRTGSFKSEVMSLFQSLYGPEMDARHLPGSWSSTENALEAMAHCAANAAFVIDDFVPHGSAWQQRAYQGKAERIFRSQGNQAGRQRLTDVSSTQQTMYPRGVVLSTGEDTPEGHSVRGRMLIRETKPGDVKTTDLSAAQANRPLYCGTVAWLAQSLAKNPVDLSARANELRDQALGVGHTRTPPTLGKLVAVAEDFLQRAKDDGFITEQQRRKYKNQAVDAMMTAGDEQKRFLEQSDPVDVFCNTLRQVFAAGTAHIRSISGGVPKNAEQMGWVSESSMDDGPKSYKARGTCIGWASAKKDELYLEPNVAIALLKKVAGAEIPLSKNTLIKRISEAGKLVRRDATGERLTSRVTVDGAVRYCLVMRLSETLDLTTEVVDEE